MIDPVQAKSALAQKLPEPGRYRHFKGNEYELLMVARHSETEELLAVYFAVDEPERIWVRPVAMFAERIYDGGCLKPRFEPAPEASAESERKSKLSQAARDLIDRLSRSKKAERGYSRAPSMR